MPTLLGTNPGLPQTNLANNQRRHEFHKSLFFQNGLLALHCKIDSSIHDNCCISMTVFQNGQKIYENESYYLYSEELFDKQKHSVIPEFYLGDKKIEIILSPVESLKKKGAEPKISIEVKILELVDK